ncbi:MAG TPA: aminotransferase class III-fold pyridoxal phosphate-dependent enzyme [Candidatus Dormibacteraeota bacterium]|nr:aminotransferase class III-fold pyridoxal phosphate-dependent enzyme [Candidatus Dormibacteraeota bacterium]
MREAPVSKPIQESEAVEIARRLFGVEAAAHSLPGEYDDSFHLCASDGSEFVLKVMHPDRESGFVEMQCAVLQHLAKNASELPLPRVVPSANGDSFVEHKVSDDSHRLVWLLTFLNGKTLAEFRPHSPGLLEELGEFLGKLDDALESFIHPAAHRELKWDAARASWIRDYLQHITEVPRRMLVQRFLGLFEAEVAPQLPHLRKSVIYGDANDYNVLVTCEPGRAPRLAGVIDFGDTHYGITISELATAIAYAILGEKDVLAAASKIVAGYNQQFPLREEEIALLYPLIGMRLAVSVVNSAYRKSLKPDDSYVTVSEAPAWEALERLAKIFPRFANYTFRTASGFAPIAKAMAVAASLKKSAQTAASILDCELRKEPCVVLDLSVGSTFLGADPSAAESKSLAEAISAALDKSGARVAIGRYDEPRLLYNAPQFGASKNPTDERRTIHLGLDLFVEPETALHAPLAGIVHLLANNAIPLDYGPLVVLKHATGPGKEFFTLYGHLTEATLQKLCIGQSIAQGEVFAYVGSMHENGGWAPHVHFQIILDMLDRGADFPGVARASERELWKALSPDPNLLLGVPADRFPKTSRNTDELLAARKKLLGGNLSVSYNKPLHIVRGWKQFLYDETGRAFLDVYNNVPLVGHSHLRVVEAAQKQLALLNTNTRYLHENVLCYAERLTELLPEPLKVCFFVNSGSEANELALRLARARIGSDDVIVLQHAYHGHTNTLIDVSPYKFNGPGGRGQKPWIHVAPIADDYRGLYRRGDSNLGTKYAAHVGEITEKLCEQNRRATFLAETLPSVAGQIVFPQNYLAEAYRHVRAAGGVCIADEVQVGFGRLGTHFWGFETQGVIPDIVVFGKPIGNAFPLAAVVTTPEIAASFANGMEFFSTFGGNPVACAVGLAVLDVIRDENLQQNAKEIGDHWLAGLKELQLRHELLGDIRGSGLFLGLDLVRNRDTREPATAQANYVVNRLRERGVLAGTDGPHHNVIKLRPPLIFAEFDADLFNATLDSILTEDPARP